MNLEKLFDKVTELGGNIKQSTIKYVPAMLSEDKRFANAWALSLAALICADQLIEEDETVSALSFIQTSPDLREMNMVTPAIEFYAEFVDDMAKTFGSPAFIVERAKLIETHIRVLTNETHKAMIRAMVNKLAGRNANAEEKQIKSEILAAL